MNRILLCLVSTLSCLAILAQAPAPTNIQPIPAPGLPAPAAPAPALEPPPVTEPKPPADAPKKPKKKPAATTLPFRGRVDAADAKAMTVTLAGKEKHRVLNVTSKTRFEKDGKPATFADIKAGDDVRGSYAKTPEGENVVRLIIGAAAPAGEPKPAGEAKPKKSAKKDSAKKAEAPAEQH